jgi:hypothetical protein
MWHLCLLAYPVAFALDALVHLEQDRFRRSSTAIEIEAAAEAQRLGTPGTRASISGGLTAANNGGKRARKPVWSRPIAGAFWW